MGELSVQSLPRSFPCSTDLSMLRAAGSYRANNFLLGQNSAMFIYIATLITATFWWSPCVWQASAAVFWEATALLSPMHSPMRWEHSPNERLSTGRQWKSSFYTYILELLNFCSLLILPVHILQIQQLLETVLYTEYNLRWNIGKN